MRLTRWLIPIGVLVASAVGTIVTVARTPLEVPDVAWYATHPEARKARIQWCAADARHADDPRPLDETSSWRSTRGTSRAYLHHLVRSGETLGAMLLSDINVAYYQRLMSDVREAIEQGTFADFCERTRSDWEKGDITAR